jgi:hypothetical protein
MFRRWTEGTLESVLAAILIALIPGGVVTYLARIKSAWTGPILHGLSAVALTVFIILAIDAIRRLPPKHLIPNFKNIETCVRTWLDRFRVTVKNDPVPTAYFRLLATVDSGTKMHIGRPREMGEYVVIRANLAPGQNDLELLEALPKEECNTMMLNLLLELARRNVGYSGLVLPAQDFHIFKRVPITASLTEHEFVNALQEVESAAHAVGIVFGMAIKLDVPRANPWPRLPTS